MPIEQSESLRIQSALEPSRRYCRPWTRDFVEDLSEVFYDRFHEQIQVNSAVRTVKVQKQLRRKNRNAAPAEGEVASSHLAGITVDLQRRGLTKDEIHFIEYYLFYLRALGLVEPEEERRHWCFHIMVSDRYEEWRQTQTLLPRPRQRTPTSQWALPSSTSMRQYPNSSNPCQHTGPLWCSISVRGPFVIQSLFVRFQYSKFRQEYPMRTVLFCV